MRQSSLRDSSIRRRSLLGSRTAADDSTQARSASLASESELTESGTRTRSSEMYSLSLMTAAPLGETLAKQVHEILGPFGYAHSGVLERRDLLRGGSGRTRDDRASVAHTTSGRRRLASDEAHDRLLHVLLHEPCSLLLVRPTDLSHHGDGVGAGIGFECRETINEDRAVDRIAANADACRLPKPGAGELIYDFICQCSRAADDADVAGCTDTTGNDPDLRASRRDETRTIRTDQSRAALSHEGIHLRHVEDGHA